MNGAGAGGGLWGLKMGVISRRAELHRCRPSHAMSSEFCLNFVSFFTIGLADAHIQPSGFPPPVTADHPLFSSLCQEEITKAPAEEDEPRNLLYRNAPHYFSCTTDFTCHAATARYLNSTPPNHGARVGALTPDR